MSTSNPKSYMDTVFFPLVKAPNAHQISLPMPFRVPMWSEVGTLLLYKAIPIAPFLIPIRPFPCQDPSKPNRILSSLEDVFCTSAALPLPWPFCSFGQSSPACARIKKGWFFLSSPVGGLWLWGLALVEGSDIPSVEGTGLDWTEWTNGYLGTHSYSSMVLHVRRRMHGAAKDDLPAYCLVPLHALFLSP